MRGRFTAACGLRPLALPRRYGRAARFTAAPRKYTDEIRRVFLMSSSGLARSEEHTSELQSQSNLVCRLLLEKKKTPLALERHQPTVAPSTLYPMQVSPAIYHYS